MEDITSVTLAWKLPLNVDTSFSDSVQYIVSSNGTSSSSETVSSMSYEFSQLTPNTSYTFEVRAKSSFGMSNPMTLTGMTLLIRRFIQHITQNFHSLFSLPPSFFFSSFSRSCGIYRCRDGE